MEAFADKNRSILIVDDNPDNLDLLAATFRDVNLNVETARSVAEARQILIKNADFDIILSDISMPVETGFDLINWLSTNNDMLVKELPVLLITSELPHAENRIHGLALGAVDYVIRPLPNEELILRVGHAIDNVRRYKHLRRSLQDVENQANVGRLLAASNHEIRNLTGLVLVAANSLATNFVRSSSSSTTAMHQTIHNLTNSAELLADISRNMSSLLSERNIKFSSLNLNLLISQTLELTALKCKGIKVVFSEDKNQNAWVNGNPSRIKQILINFIFNACDSLSETENVGNGEVKLRITEAVQEHWQIRVEDNGIGLLKKTRIETFTPFQTTKSIRGGTGLGLWLCSQLARSMNGSIYLESDGAGKGATAVLSIPKSKPPSPQDQFDISKYL